MSNCSKCFATILNIKWKICKICKISDYQFYNRVQFNEKQFCSQFSQIQKSLSKLNVNVIWNDNEFCKRRAIAFNVVTNFEFSSHFFKRIRLILHSFAKRFRFILRFFVTSKTNSVNDKTKLHNLQIAIRRLQKKINQYVARLRKIRNVRFRRQILRKKISQMSFISIQFLRKKISHMQNLRNSKNIFKIVQHNVAMFANEFE